MKKFSLPTITAGRMLEAQREFNAQPAPRQMFWEEATQTLCRIHRNRQGEILYIELEGPLNREQGAQRLQAMIDGAEYLAQSREGMH